MNTGKQINGINQWYVNALRDENSLTNTNSFIKSWTEWGVNLTYQTNTTINTSATVLDNQYYDITKKDYTVSLKKSPGAEEKWLHGLLVSVESVGSAVANSTGLPMPSADGSDWVFRIDTMIPTSDSLQYYSVRKYHVSHVDILNNTVKFANSNVPWKTGDNVVINYDSPTFISGTTYQLTKQGFNTYSITKFDVVDQIYTNVLLYDVIKCYTPDDLALNPVLHNYDLKYDVSGLMQYRKNTHSWVKYTNGYNEFLLPVNNRDLAIINDGEILPTNLYSVDGNKVTLHSGVNIKNLEVRIPIAPGIVFQEVRERFSALNYKTCKLLWPHIELDKTNVVSVQTPMYIKSVQGIIDFIDGYAGKLKDSGFIFNDYERPRIEDNGTQTASWQLETEKFIDKVWRGFNKTFDVKLDYSPSRVYDYHEINPFKYELWISTPHGIVADVLSGPYHDVSLSPLVYDQSGDVISAVDNLKVYRTDKETHITYTAINRPDNIVPRHIGGMHVFIDHYEHIITLNDYTTTDNLIHDSFLGLANESIEVELYKHFEVTKRPNSGGSVLVDNHLINNIESNTQNLQDFYNTYADNEQQQYISTARQLVGYNNMPYFGYMDSKTKFLFWKGMIHYKGSNVCTDMFIKPGLLNKVSVDEVWAYKVMNYGSSEGKVEQYVNMFDSDIVRHTILYQFTDMNPADYFISVKQDNLLRWLKDTKVNNVLVEPEVTSVSRYEFSNYEHRSTPHVLTTYKPHKKSFIETETCDRHELYVERNYGVIHLVNYTQSQIIIPEYVPGTGMLTCYNDGKIIEVTEVNNTAIKLPGITKKTPVTIIYGRGKLIQGVHYEVLRNNLIKLLGRPIYDILDIYTYNASNDLTVGIIDRVNNIKVYDLHLYDPIRGYHNPRINDLVRFIEPNDPANYGELAWNQHEVGLKWINNKHLGYYKYNDLTVYPNIADRVALWGSTSAWSHIDCYEWIESSVHPQDWISRVEYGTVSTNESKYVGKPHTILQKRTRLNAFDNWSQWYTEENTYQVLNVCDYTVIGDFKFKVTLKINVNTDTYRLYVNEIEYSNYDIEVNESTLVYMIVKGVDVNDTIRLIRIGDKPDSSTINSDTSANNYEYRLQYVYNTITHYDDVGKNTTTMYYFWVTNQINRSTSGLSTIDIESLFIHNKNPYYCHQNLQDTYDQWIIKNVAHIDRNYALQVIKDNTISNEYKDINTHSDNTEWQLFSKHALDRVPRKLWDKITESMVGYTLINKTELPDTNMALYDRLNSTTTQYGFELGQVLGEPHVITGTIIDLLRSTDFDTIPIDKNTFLHNYFFDTPEHTIKTMDYMYTTFTPPVVNEIFFNVLNIALTYTTELDGILKTSYITLDCEKIINYV